MSRHTPGPWEIKGTVKDNIVAIRRNGAGKPTGYTFVATTPVLSQNAPLYDEERRANARLIAAAPKLLEQLQELLKAYREAVKLWDPNTDDAFTVNARKAIAEAISEKEETI